MTVLPVQAGIRAKKIRSTYKVIGQVLTSTLSLSYSRKSKSLKTVPKWSAFSSRSFRESLGMDKSGADTSSVLLAMLECRSRSSELWLKITCTKTWRTRNVTNSTPQAPDLVSQSITTCCCEHTHETGIRGWAC